MSKKTIIFLLTLSSLAVFTLGTVFAATAVSATFDFDTGLPALNPYGSTPFGQTATGVTANFSSGFSVQNLNSLGANSVVMASTNSYFSGLFLWPNTVNRDNLTITFDANITSITMYFKTAELRDPNPGSTGSPISLAAYTGSSLVGSPATAYGNETVYNTYPEGTLAYNSGGQPFTSVVIFLPSTQTQGASGFIIDNITVVGTTDVVPEFYSAYVFLMIMLFATVSALVAKRDLTKIP